LAPICGPAIDAEAVLDCCGTVTSFVVPALPAVNITPGVTAPNDGDEILSSINMTISKAQSVNIRWNGEVVY
jgi:hypothetical protein